MGSQLIPPAIQVLIEDEIHFLFYCKLYQNTQEYRDFVLEFGVNKVEFKALLPEDKWKRVWQTDKKHLS